MAQIGLKNLYAAELLTDESGVATYAAPFPIVGAIQADIAPTSAEASLYADDALVFVAKEFTGGTLTLGTADLPLATRATLLGQTMDADGVLYASGQDNPPYFAVAFEGKRADGTIRYVWLYKVKFAQPNESAQTKGETLNFQTPSIVGTFMKRSDGHWKADYIGVPSDPAALGWFNRVREISMTATPAAQSKGKPDKGADGGK